MSKKIWSVLYIWNDDELSDASVLHELNGRKYGNNSKSSPHHFHLWTINKNLNALFVRISHKTDLLLQSSDPGQEDTV